MEIEGRKEMANEEMVKPTEVGRRRWQPALPIPFLPFLEVLRTLETPPYWALMDLTMDKKAQSTRKIFLYDC